MSTEATSNNPLRVSSVWMTSVCYSLRKEPSLYQRHKHCHLTLVIIQQSPNSVMLKLLGVLLFMDFPEHTAIEGEGAY